MLGMKTWYSIILLVAILLAELSRAQNQTISPSKDTFFTADDMRDLISDFSRYDSSANKSATTTGITYYEKLKAAIKSQIYWQLTTVFGANATVDSINRLKTFQHFMQQYKRTYSTHEVMRKFSLFATRLRMIEQSVRDYLSGNSTYKMAINKYIDWDDQLMKALTPIDLKRIKPYLSLWSDLRGKSDDEQLPKEKDWRKSNCMSPINDQGQCGACYAFSSLGVLETMNCIEGGEQSPNMDLSEQQVVDCAKGFDNFGCEGGWPPRAIDYMNNVGFVARESCYEYKAVESESCRESAVSGKPECTVSASIKDIKPIVYKELKGSKQMKQHLANHGPLVGVLQANDKFVFYKTGVFTDSDCDKVNTSVNHAIIFAGYGVENSKKYWLIKNSWGTDWGEDGYGKIRRGVNECSVEDFAWALLKANAEEKKMIVKQ